jgi:heme A synthase
MKERVLIFLAGAAMVASDLKAVTRVGHLERAGLMVFVMVFMFWKARNGFDLLPECFLRLLVWRDIKGFSADLAIDKQ